jgi:hypothetical protein
MKLSEDNDVETESVERGYRRVLIVKPVGREKVEDRQPKTEIED